MSSTETDEKHCKGLKRHNPSVRDRAHPVEWRPDAPIPRTESACPPRPTSNRAPLDRQAVFELIRDRLADILEIDPGTITEGAVVRRRPRRRLARADRARRGARGGAGRAHGRLPHRGRRPRGPEDRARRRRLRLRPGWAKVLADQPAIEALRHRIGHEFAGPCPARAGTRPSVVVRGAATPGHAPRTSDSSSSATPSSARSSPTTSTGISRAPRGPADRRPQVGRQRDRAGRGRRAARSRPGVAARARARPRPAAARSRRSCPTRSRR